MKYTIVSNATSEKVIGKTYPQCTGVPNGFDFTWYEEANSMTLLNNNHIPNFTPNLIFELDHRSILTDVISPSNISARGLLCNTSVKKTIEKHSLDTHKFYEGRLIHKNSELIYWWFHPLKTSIETIDFKFTKFYETNLLGHKIKDLEINSILEFKTQYELSRKKLQKIRSNQLTFKNLSFDIFIIPELHSHILISEKLKQTLSTYSGLTFKEQQ